MHKNIQFQVSVTYSFLTEVLIAVDQSGLERWQYLNQVVDDVLGKGAHLWACGSEVYNRKGMRTDYWKTYQRIPFILTTRGLAALGQRRDEEGYPTMSSFLRAHLTERVCADLGLDPSLIEHPRRAQRGDGFRRLP